MAGSSAGDGALDLRTGEAKLGSRFHLELGPQSRHGGGVPCPGLHWPPGQPQRLDQMPVAPLIEGQHPGPPLGPGGGLVPVAPLGCAADQLVERSCEILSQPFPLHLEPGPKRFASDVLQPGQEVTPPPFHRFHRPPLGDRGLESGGIEPDGRGIEPHQLAFGGQPVTHDPLQLQQRLPQGLAGPGLVGSLPEQRGQFGARHRSGRPPRQKCQEAELLPTAGQARRPPSRPPPRPASEAGSRARLPAAAATSD